ncbi:MAG: protein kinase [bacterium]
MIGNILRYRYELIEKIGDGFLFSVFRARDRVQNRVIVVKLVRNPFYENAQLTEALRQAAFTTARLSNPAVARVYEIDEHEGMPFLITEYARGANLKERIRRVAPLSVPVAIDTAIGIAEGVDAGHRAGIVHADLCPQNVVVGMEGNIKVTDFGLSSVFTTVPEVRTAYLSRESAYLPPEVIKGESPSVVTDVFSLGIILYEMLTGDLPSSTGVTNATANNSERTLPSLRVLNPAVPSTVEEMVMKAADPSSESRYQTAAELLYDLKTVRDALRFGKPLTWSPKAASARSEMAEASIRSATAPPIVIPEVAPTLIEPVAQAPIEVVKEVKPVVNEKPNQSEPPQPVSDDRQRPTYQEIVYEDVGVPLWLKIIWGTLLATVILGVLFFVAVLFFNWTSPSEVAMPSLIGKNKEDAKKLLEGLKLTMVTVKTDFNDEYAPDTIYLTKPPAKKPIKAGAEVEVWVSGGSRFVGVPNIINQSEEEARKIIKGVDLQVAQQSKQEQNDTIPYGFVIRQNPEPGKKLEHGRLVELTISSGPRDEGVPVTTTDNGDKMRIFEINVKLPRGTDDIPVKIDVEDDNGLRTAWDGVRTPGEQMVQQVTGIGQNITIRVYVNNRLVKELPVTN